VAAMASVTASIVAAPVVALSASTSTSASTSSRTQLAGSFLQTRAVAPLEWASKTVSNGSRVNAFNVVNPEHNIKFETLSFLPPLTDDQIAKQIDYMLRNGWIPTIEFDKSGVVSQTALKLPGYYDGRYWSMWKLPLFGAKDSSQVLSEINEAQKAYPESFIRVIGFDNVRQVQIVSFIVKKPAHYVS
jgi:ribulose-bisphosphate carboxylase small chain